MALFYESSNAFSRVVIDEESLCERGTSIAAFDYGSALKRAGFRVQIIFSVDKTVDSQALKKFDDNFEIFGYKTAAERSKFVRSEPTLYYFLQTREGDYRRFENCVSACHAVFDFLPNNEVDRFAYVSQWLSDFLSAGRAPVVPHIVSLPCPKQNLRSAWGVPEEAVVLGRHGGFDTFNVPFVPQVMREILARRRDIWFVFVNTQKSIEHDRIIYLDAMYTSQEKSDFINSCDAMIHARFRGESFGLAIAEFLLLNKAVFCWLGGRDRNHVYLQPNPENLYSTAKDLLNKILAYKVVEQASRGDCVRAMFSEQQVMAQFKTTFFQAGESFRLTRSERLFWNCKRRAMNRLGQVRHCLWNHSRL